MQNLLNPNETWEQKIGIHVASCYIPSKKNGIIASSFKLTSRVITVCTKLKCLEAQWGQAHRYSDLSNESMSLYVYVAFVTLPASARIDCNKICTIQELELSTDNL